MSAKSRNRNRCDKNSEDVKSVGAVPGTEPPSLEPQLAEIRERCTECGACTRACAFLAHYGTPKAIASGFDFSAPRDQIMAYECSLCGLCRAVCPENLDPHRLFLEARRRFVAGGNFDAARYRAILGYEARGSSALFSWYGLPRGCDTVFFPGCNLPGTRPEVTLQMFRHLQKIVPALGIVLDCCTKPSYDLGRQAYFESMFGEMAAYLTGQGIRTVLAACPSCFSVFQHHGNGIRVRSVYEVIHESGGVKGAHYGSRKVVVHDPCTLRYETNVHQAIRSLLRGMGLSVAQMKHSGKLALCCGEGGMVQYVKPEFAGNWSLIRARECGGRQVVAYCGGCITYLNRVVPSVHIADLLYRSADEPNSNPKIARAPFTYVNRLLLKHRLKKELKPQTSRVRPRGLGQKAPKA
jgi:Fe-S oxidoreductase